jgi:hypothetical protein
MRLSLFNLEIDFEAAVLADSIGQVKTPAGADAELVHGTQSVSLREIQLYRRGQIKSANIE